MLNLSIGPLDQPASHKPSDLVDKTDATFSDDEQLQDMFKIPAEVLAHQDTTPPKSRLNPQAEFKYGQRTLPPPPGLRRPRDDPDTQNVVLQAIQTPKVVDTRVNVANPWNTDLLDLNQDAS